MATDPYGAIFGDLGARVRTPAGPPPLAPSLDDDPYAQILGSLSAPDQPTDHPEEPSLLRKGAAFATRVGLPIIGGVVGTALAPGVGTAGGAALGAALGAGIGGVAGEVAGEKIMGEDLDPVEIALAGPLAAVPAGPIGRMLAKPGLNLAKRAALHAGEGAAQGMLDATARAGVKEGRLPTGEEVGYGAAGGAVLGGGLGLGLEKALSGSALRPPVQPKSELQSSIDQAISPGLTPPPPPEPIVPEAPPVDVAAERAFLTPDPEAAANEYMARATRQMLQERRAPRTPESVAAEMAALQPAEPALPEVWEGPGPVRMPWEVAQDVSDLQTDQAIEAAVQAATGPGGAPRLAEPSVRLSRASRAAGEVTSEEAQAAADAALLARVEAERAARPATVPEEAVPLAQPRDVRAEAAPEPVQPEIVAPRGEEAAKAILAQPEPQGVVPPGALETSPPPAATLLPAQEIAQIAPQAISEEPPRRVLRSREEAVQLKQGVGLTLRGLREQLAHARTVPAETRVQRLESVIRVAEGELARLDGITTNKYRQVIENARGAIQGQIRQAKAVLTSTRRATGEIAPAVKRPDAFERAQAKPAEQRTDFERRLTGDDSVATDEVDRYLIQAAPALHTQGQPEFRTDDPLSYGDAAGKDKAKAIAQDGEDPLYREMRRHVEESGVAEEAPFRTDDLGPSKEGEAEFYATKPAPGQRGLEGIAEDIPERGVKPRGPEQASMFKGEMLQPSVSRTTEGREGEGALFTQDADARAKAEAKAQEQLFAVKPFYSQLERVSEKIPQPMKGADMARYLSDPKRGVKAEEMKWTGLDDFLRERAGQRVTPQEVREFIKQNEVRVEETTIGEKPALSVERAKAIMARGGQIHGVSPDGKQSMGVTLDDGKTLLPWVERNPASVVLREGTFEDSVNRRGEPKFSQYQTSGGENYRELLLTLPSTKRRLTEAENRERSLLGTKPKLTPQDKARYDELSAIELAPKTDFKGGHFDEPNVLAHVRFNERTDADGKRVLFIEEVQSDWAQKGRREGFAAKADESKIAALEAEIDSAETRVAEANRKILDLPERQSDDWIPETASDEYRRLKDEWRQADTDRGAAMNALRIARRDTPGIPPAPFVGKTEAWSELAMKRMVRWAAENGFDRVAWTKGKQQIERYPEALRQVVDKIKWTNTAEDGSKFVQAMKNGETVFKGTLNKDGTFHDYAAAGKHVSDVLGKGMAEKVLASGAAGEIEGKDFTVGGKGMEGFYDQILPQVAGRLGKKFGARVGETRIKGGDQMSKRGEELAALWERGEIKEGSPEYWEMQRESGAFASAHSLDITPEMRASVMEGQPMFRAGERAPSKPLTIEAVREGVPGFDFKPHQDGSFRAPLANGSEVQVSQVGDIVIRDKAALARSMAAAGSLPADTPVGMTRIAGRKAIVQIAEGAPDGTIDHEAYHVIEQLALTPKEMFAVAKRYGNVEQRAYAYADWAKDRRTRVNSWFSRIMQFARRISHHFKPTSESTFEEVASGRASKRIATQPKEGELYAAAPSMPPQMPAKPVGPAPEPALLGRPKPPGEPPRVEQKVGALKELQPNVKLSRDAERSWKSLDPKIRKRLDDILETRESEENFYQKATGGKLSDVDVQALDALVTGKRESYDSARQRLLEARAADGDTGPVNAEFLQASFDHAAAQLVRASRSDVEAGTKLARALAARARVMDAAKRSTPDQFLKDVFKQIPEVSDKQAADLLRILEERPQDLADALMAVTKPTWFRKWMEFWKAGLVSAPGTQVANLLGNLGEQVAKVGETVTAAAIDPFLGGGLTRLKGEARAEMGGALAGAGKSLGQLGRDLRDIVKLAPEKIDLSKPLEYQTGAIAGKKGRAIRVPFRLLSAFDNFFKGLGGEAELYKLAYRQAGGNAERMRKILQNPPDDLIRAVTESRQARTFQEPNRIAQKIMGLRNDFKPLQVVVPFVQTPANIAARTWQRSPAGFYEGYKALRAYRKALSDGLDAAEVAKLKGEAVDKLARPLFGTMLLGTFATVAKAGGMTGSGPTDHNERNLLRNTGWQPYSFVVPGTDGKKVYLPFNRFEPVSSLLGMAADMIEARDSKTAGDLFDKGLGSIVQNFSSKTYLQGIADAAEVVNDPKRFASQYVANFTGSQVPNVIAKMAQAVDPVLRETKAETTGLAGIPQRVGRSVAARIPGLSTTLPARRSGTGEEVERSGNAATRLLSPVQPSVEKEGSELEQLLVRIGYPPGQPRRELTIKGKKIRTSDREYALLQDANKMAADYIRKTYLRNSRFQRMPDTEAEGGKNSKEYLIKRVYDRYREHQKQRVYRSPDFRRAYQGAAQ